MIVDEKIRKIELPAPAAAGVQTLATPAKKIDEGKGRAHTAQVSRAARNKHATETPEAALTWDTLPKTCPSVMCSDALPREPVAKILSLFEKCRAQQKLGEKGVRIIELKICTAITTERRKGAVFASRIRSAGFGASSGAGRVVQLVCSDDPRTTLLGIADFLVAGRRRSSATAAKRIELNVVAKIQMREDGKRRIGS
ncbi:hypothetical protein R3P38DRAFT_2807931 [Favolaschia claudopus]|uniref:Uncharacterized protein n=1 Tax=Favolaschia claudopus TaxID=2862362 RepID=A0AAV9ZI92_9AGAR